MTIFGNVSFDGQSPVLTLASSFGLDQTTLGPEFPAREIINSQRAKLLDYRSKFFKCTQHDWKGYDWSGRMRAATSMPTQPLIGGSMPEIYISLDQRRPATPYRLARTIVSAFTSLIFGHGRWPLIKSYDPNTTEFTKELVRVTKLQTKMIRARNMAGSSGTVGISWGFFEGIPKVRLHDAKNLHVIEWDDEDEFIPSHVTEIYQYPKDVWNAKKKKYERRLFWFRRDWTKNADIQFVSCEVTDENPSWQIDEERSMMHGNGFCHFVWVQNLPEDDVTSVDGAPDYDMLFEQLDSVDIVNSVNVGGTIQNLDPTLKLRMDQDTIGEAVVRKGSQNAIVTGTNGDASYLELSGTAVQAGQATIKQQREQILESCQCVIPDPNEVVASSTSSVALKIVYAPMLSKGDVMRDQFGDAIVRILEGMLKSARLALVGQEVKEIEVDENDSELVDEEGNPMVRDVRYELNMEPLIVNEEILDDEGNPTGEYTVTKKPRVPGEGTLTLEWPAYFKETTDDKSKQSSMLVSACGNKQILSQKTASEIIAATMQLDTQQEWFRIVQEQQAARDNIDGMYPPTGGRVDNETDLPDGSSEEVDEEETRTADASENE